MRLTALTLTKYGNFAAERIDFDPRPGRLNILAAPNGAGKSVLRGAFADLLFGIGGQTPMGFRHGYPGMAIMAEAIGPDGTPFTFGRLKGQGNPLIDGERNRLDPVVIARLLGGIDRQRLERLFALDTERLRMGGADLSASGGGVAEALESGAGGFHRARQVRKTLEEQRDGIAPIRRSAQRPFYKALDEYNTARRQVGLELLKPEQWRKEQQELDAMEQRRRERNAAADIASEQIARLERVRRVAPLLDAHDLALSWLTGHPDAPVLDPMLAARLTDAQSSIVVKGQRAAREAAAAADFQAQRETIVLDTALLTRAEALDQLAAIAGAARKAANDLPGLQAQAAGKHARVDELLRELGRPLPFDRAREAIPQRAVIGRARRLLQTYEARAEAARDAPARVASLEKERDAIAAKLAALPPALGTGVLDGLMKEIRAGGDPARAEQEASAALTAADAALAAAIARVPGWTDGLAALVSLAPLPLPSYERLVADRDDATRAEAAALDVLTDARRSFDTETANLAAIAGTTPLPDQAGLDHARTRRDLGWRLIYRHAFTPDPPTQAEERAFAGDLPLPLAFERAIAAADALVDRWVENAALVERASAARVAIQRAEERVHGLEARHRLASEQRAASERTWFQVCAGLSAGTLTGEGPAKPPGVAEVRAFLAARDRVIDAAEKQKSLAAGVAALTHRHAAWAARLAAALGSPLEDLPALLAGGDQRLNAARLADRLRTRLETEQDGNARNLAETIAARTAAEGTLAAWRADWDQARRDLHRPEQEDPGVTGDLLQTIAELDGVLSEAVTLDTRVSAILNDHARFMATVSGLTAAIAPDLGGTDPFDAVSELTQRLRTARARAKEHDLLTQQLEAASAAAAEADRAAAESGAELQAVLALTGAETIEAARERLALAADRARHTAALAEIGARLTEAGDRRSLEDLRAEVAAEPADTLRARQDALERDRKDAQDAAQDAAARAAEMRQRMEREATGTKAGDAEADRQAAAATMGRVLEEALVLHIAAAMLGRALKDAEKSGESDKIRRIGDLFGKLTNGVYTGVATEFVDDGRLRLMLPQRDFPDERQPVEALSEGTRDQLFLALRLAAIEEHAATAAPLPFIGDDILQTFDDDRAEAAMRVLLEISGKTQVILLTHHRHLLELAARLPAGTVHARRIQSLAG